jgi:hypothetical protein
VRTIIGADTELYTGEQLRSGWLEERFSLAPDAIAAFRGPCDVAREYMIDLEDLEAGETIVAADMLHFIAEHDDADLARAVLRQRLLVCCAAESLLALRAVRGLTRDGDDLFVDDSPLEPKRKLSVSIATGSSRHTTLIHLGINVDPRGAPVPAIGLRELGVDPSAYARDVLSRYAHDVDAAAHASTKVREAP